MADTPLFILIVHDGKPGHLSQSRGLAEAITELTGGKIEFHDGSTMPAEAPIDPSAHASGIVADWRENIRPVPGQQRHLLIICAGSQTHTKALALKKEQDSHTICLMNPGFLKRRKFDLCIIPEHDDVKASGNILFSKGALNSIAPAVEADLKQGLILIGGPSKHHGWDEVSFLDQLTELLQSSDDVQWIATSSRRTPETTEQALHQLAHNYQHLDFIPASETPQGWVGEQLQRCGTVWVTEDSVSMIYESLSAGAAVGLFNGSPSRQSRVVRGIHGLADDGYVTWFNDWQSSQTLSRQAPLQEASRIAQLVCEKFNLIDSSS